MGLKVPNLMVNFFGNWPCFFGYLRLGYKSHHINITKDTLSTQLRNSKCFRNSVRNGVEDQTHIPNLKIKQIYCKVKERVLRKQKKTSEPQEGIKSRKGKGVKNRESPLCLSHFCFMQWLFCFILLSLD